MPVSLARPVEKWRSHPILDTLAFIEQPTEQKPIQIPIPVIDRSILDRLDPPKSNSRKAKASWPPIITRIPEPLSFSTRANSRARYLIPIKIAEQESKARIHLSQLYILAQALNRTLVLPNVGKSRLGICSKWDFGIYYDLDSAEGFGVKIGEVDLKRKGTQMVYVKNRSKKKQMEAELAWEEYKGLMVAMNDTQESYLPGCLASKVDTGLPTTTPIVVYPKDTKDGAQPIGDALIEVLQRQEAELLLLEYDLRFPILPFVDFGSECQLFSFIVNSLSGWRNGTSGHWKGRAPGIPRHADTITHKIMEDMENHQQIHMVKHSRRHLISPIACTSGARGGE
ncbi:hypothetical protein MPER_10071 [Moniliophthora perniciosa FA553]|nr:hypothetical protein MPER_10071 [Moniliophthora perniciosa FA553]